MTSRFVLNPFSQRFAGALFARRPDWEDLIQTDAYPNMEAGSFLLEVPSPATATRHLSVSTDGDEVTVGFGSEWHDHYGSWTGDDEETSFRQALEAIEALLSERTVVVVGYRDGRPAWSTAQRINDQLPSWDAERYEIISWSGKHDRVEWPA